MEGDQSVLLMFDPLNSPKSGTIRDTPRRRREQDPTSPVAAFFSTVDRSKNLLQTVRKHKQGDLINLDQGHEHVAQATGVMATPLPTFRVTMDNENKHIIDPFSPATYATPSTTQFFPIPQLNLRRESAGHNSLLQLETPAKADLSMSTAFTPIPSNLPNLLNASLSSLRNSGTSSVTSSARRRRSSIDLDKELGAKSPDSSFDILRGDLEIGTSADASFITADDSLRVVDAEESPWTIRTSVAASGYKLGSSLLPVKELRESSLLAHEIPLPDSPPTSPESSEGHNEDANIHASKVFSHTRRFSMIANALQFPTEGPSPPRSPGKINQYRVNSARKPTVHIRTTSMSSISSIGSSRSGVTIKGTTPSKRAAQGTPQSPASPSKTSKTSNTSVSSIKRLPRPSIASKPPAAVVKPRMSVIAPRASLAPTVATRKPGIGAPRSSMAPPPPRPRASIASVGSMAPPPVPSAARRAPRASVQPSLGTVKAGPRPSTASIASTTRVGMKQPLRAPRASVMPSPSSTVVQGGTAAGPATTIKQSGTVLAPSVRANSTARMARPSLIGGAGAGAGALRKVASAASGFGVVKPIGTIVRPTMVKESAAPTMTTITQGLPRPRPRTSSAGAALISRPEYAHGDSDRNARLGIVRPKSSMRV